MIARIGIEEYSVGDLRIRHGEGSEGDSDHGRSERENSQEVEKVEKKELNKVSSK